LARCEARLAAMLDDFRWTSIRDLLLDWKHGLATRPSREAASAM
jgi:hypothetical protein